MMNDTLKPNSKDFQDEFLRDIAERDWSKVSNVDGVVFLRNEDNISFTPGLG